MEASRRAAAEAASRRNVPYPTGDDVVGCIFNPLGTGGRRGTVRASSVFVRPASVSVAVRACRGSVVRSVRLVSQHTPVSLGVGSRGDMYSGGISTGQFMMRARSRQNSWPCSGFVKKISDHILCRAVAHC